MTAERLRKHANEETSENVSSVRAKQRKNVRQKVEQMKTLQLLAFSQKTGR